MKSIGELADELGGERPTETRHCEKEGHGDYTSTNIIGKIWTRCPACNEEQKQAEERERVAAMTAAREAVMMERIGRAGIPERFKDRSLKNYNAQNEGQRAALECARNYADNYPEVREKGRCLLFIGMPGTGKTHLACGIAQRVMRRHGAAALFITVQDAILLIKDTWTKGAAMSESQAINTLVSPDLLILDEVGVQLGSDFEKATLFNVINKRYERRKPTIFLSNLADYELAAYLGERVMDRLKEDGGQVVPFNWESQRPKLADARENTWRHKYKQILH